MTDHPDFLIHKILLVWRGILIQIWFFFSLPSLFFFSLSCPIHNLRSVYTELRGLLSASYSQTIKLLTVWLIVPQFDLRGIRERSAMSVSKVCWESGLHVCALWHAFYWEFVSFWMGGWASCQFVFAVVVEEPETHYRNYQDPDQL